jgi:DNA-binding GntR family transcriptional regulator
MATKMKLKEKAYNTIRKKIFNFELKPGEVFFETGISKKIGVSRTPIREALNRLEQEGLISRLPDRGYCVVDITVSEIEELYELREVLETLALRTAAIKAKKKDWIRLEKRLLGQEAPQQESSEKDFDRFFVDAQQFDQEITELCAKATLKKMIDMVTDRVNRFRWMNIFFKDRAEESRKEHLEIIGHLKEGDVEEAIAATQKHIRHSRDSILTLLSRKKNLLYIDSSD